jgi:hypothetical protein
MVLPIILGIIHLAAVAYQVNRYVPFGRRHGYYYWVSEPFSLFLLAFIVYILVSIRMESLSEMNKNDPK